MGKRNAMIISHTTTWNESLAKGKVKEQIFKEDFGDYLNIGMFDVSSDTEYAKNGIDYIIQNLGVVDVKSYKDDGYIVLEEDSIIEQNKKGWFYTSKANFFIFVSTYTRIMLLLRNDKKFKDWWESHKQNYELKYNDTDGKWHSSYRKVPIQHLKIAWYKKNNRI